MNHRQHNGAGEPDFYSRSRVPSCPVSPAVNISGAGLPPSSVSYPHTIGQSGSCNLDGGAPNQQTINPERNLAFANIGVARGPAYIEDMLDRALSHHGIAKQVELENVFYAAVWGWLTTR